MPTLLRIDASARTTGSHSHELGDHVEQHLLNQQTGLRIVRRNLATHPVPQITNETIAGFYAPPDQMTEELRAATALSDELIAELKSASILLFTVPMYNFSVPAAFKAWIDQVVRINQTFEIVGREYRGVLDPGTRAYLCTSYGGFGYMNGPMQALNFLDPYVKALLGFLGVSKFEVFGIEQATMPDVVVHHTAQVKAQVDAHFANLVSA